MLTDQLFLAPKSIRCRGLGDDGIGVARTDRDRAMAVARETSALLFVPNAGNVWQDDAQVTAGAEGTGVGALKPMAGAVLATQATSANKPILRKESTLGYRDVWYLDFDGVNDVLGTTFAHRNEYCIVAAVQMTNLANSGVLFGSRGSANTSGLYAKVTASEVSASCEVSSLAKVLRTTSIGDRLVISTWVKSGVGVGISVNGVVNFVSSSATCVLTDATALLRFGVQNGLWSSAAGGIFAVAAMPLVPSDVQRKSIERYFAQLSGVTLS